MATTLLTRKKLDIINNAEVQNPDMHEEEKAKWMSKKVSNSMTGRIVRSSYETIRSTGANIVCLSPWGDSNPFSLPCIRFRDIAIHMVTNAVGGATSVITTPIMSHVADVFVGSLMDTIMVEIIDAGIQFAADSATDAVNEWIEESIEKAIPIHSGRLITTSARDLKITLKYKHSGDDAELGFFRSSVHKDVSISSKVKDYLSIEKGWFSPYLNASGRRPIIPRYLKPDVIYCHGPFTSGDYKIAEELLKDSTFVISLSVPEEVDEKTEKFDEDEEIVRTESPPPEYSVESNDVQPKEAAKVQAPEQSTPSKSMSTRKRMFNKIEAFRADPKESMLKLKEKSMAKLDQLDMNKLKEKSIDKIFKRPKTPEPHHSRTKPEMIMALVGIKPYRHMWNQSARPGESVLHYILLNGCPTIVIPTKVGAPLLAWDTLTLEHLWKVDLPTKDGELSDSGKFEGIVGVLLEYLDFFVDWDRIRTPNIHSDTNESTPYHSTPQAVLRHAVTLFVAAAIRSKDSKQARKKVDPERCGIAFWRLAYTATPGKVETTPEV